MVRSPCGREFVRRCASAAADYLVIWARDGDYAYYDSKILPKPPGLGTRDPLRETIDAAAPLGMPVIAYCVVQQAGHLLATHPEWEMQAADGTRIGRYCLNSGYLDTVTAILDELLAYGIAGFHIDMLDQGFGPPIGCWCDACRSAWRDAYGDEPMPGGVTWDDSWDRMLEFRYRTSALRGAPCRARAEGRARGDPRLQVPRQSSLLLGSGPASRAACRQRGFRHR